MDNVGGPDDDGTCASCKWWGTDYVEWVDPPKGYSYCAALDSYPKVIKFQGEDRIAESFGHYGEDAGVHTKSNFGCVLWTIK